jgi:hypothetical protein
MNTKIQKLVFSKITNQKLGAIEDAVQNEIDILDSQAQDYIQQSNRIYSVIQNFFSLQENMISELSSASGINLDEVYSLIESYDEAKQYTEVDTQTYLGLVDIESVVEAADQIIRGLESIRTPGIG